MEVFKKPNSPTVYEYNPDTGDYAPISSPDEFIKRGYQWDQVQTWTDNKLADVIALDTAINDQAESELDFESYYNRFSEQDELAAKQLAKEQYARTEQRVIEDYGTDRAALDQTWQRAQQDYGLFQNDLATERGKVTRDKLQALEQIQKNRGQTLRGFYEDIGERGVARSGIRDQQESQINQAYDTQQKLTSQSASDQLATLDQQRKQAALNYSRFGRDVKTDQSTLDTTKARSLEDIGTNRADFQQSQLDTFKANRRGAFEGQRTYLRGN